MDVQDENEHHEKHAIVDAAHTAWAADEESYRQQWLAGLLVAKHRWTAAIYSLIALAVVAYAPWAAGNSTLATVFAAAPALRLALLGLTLLSVSAGGLALINLSDPGTTRWRVLLFGLNGWLSMGAAVWAFWFLAVSAGTASAHGLVSLATAVVFAATAIGVPLLSGSGWSLGLQGMGLLVLAAGVFRQVPELGLSGFTAYVLMLVGGIVGAWRGRIWQSSLARSEFHRLALAAPVRALLERSSANAAPPRLVFTTQPHFCVCLASAWRLHQAADPQRATTQLSMSLSEYYELCQALLSRHLPRGNFFLDWIGEDMFVVLFSTSAADERLLLAAAFAVASDIMDAMEAFQRLHGLAGAVDFGLATGAAVIDFIGPEKRRKVTVIGDAPRRARSLQLAGTRLRQSFGDRDRIIFTEAAARQVAADRQPGAAPWQLQSVIDAALGELSFIEATPVRKSIADQGRASA